MVYGCYDWHGGLLGLSLASYFLLRVPQCGNGVESRNNLCRTFISLTLPVVGAQIIMLCTPYKTQK
jgi:hypothetical protein